ncbi:hypothetical protein NPIL_268221 [Nephila pilipes]|uniref:Integrase catalytic domain-containing protein n=1 Tax=Nephila pilipes TaxID=299642 RepID=A0A8X6P637_NEPPI|nr:hypothetical protein NPIL_268221 [Nephila pilipes]
MRSLMDSGTGLDPIPIHLASSDKHSFATFRLVPIRLGPPPTKQRAVERFHRQLKRALMAHLPDSWPDALYLVVLGIWSSYKDNMVEASA